MRWAKVPGALVAILLAQPIKPRVAQGICDRFIMLVADQVDRGVRINTIGMLPGIAGGGHRVGVRDIGVERGRGPGSEATVVGAILREGAATATAVEATAHPPGGHHEEQGRWAGLPALCRYDVADLLLDL